MTFPPTLYVGEGEQWHAKVNDVSSAWASADMGKVTLAPLDKAKHGRPKSTTLYPTSSVSEVARTYTNHLTKIMSKGKNAEEP